MKRALFPGRFQPFHKGHLSVVEELLREYDEVVIVIGSAQEGFTCRNPFTAGERLEMIDDVLRSQGFGRDRYWLIPVPDLYKPLAWTTYVLGMVPHVDVVVSGNPHTASIYRWMGYSVLEPKMYGDGRYNGTHIRSLIARDDPSWKELVPDKVVEYIYSLDGVERIKKICGGGVESHRDRW